MISAGSRYADVERAIHKAPGARPVQYLRRRFLPPVDDSSLLAVVTVARGDRLDLLAARLQGDPQRSWRIADANAAMNPRELTGRPGSLLRIPRPGF